MRNLPENNEKALADEMMDKALKKNFQDNLVITKFGMITREQQHYNERMGWGRTFASVDRNRNYSYTDDIRVTYDKDKEKIKPNSFGELIALAKEDINKMFREK
jgi:hypothetical protein